MGLRERRRELVRREIADGALKLFATRGFEDVTVGEIAASLDVSPRTFFRYFPSKQDVLFADHEERLDEFRAALAGRPDGEPFTTSLRAASAVVTALYDDAARGETLRVRSRVIQESPTLLARNFQLEQAWVRVVEAEARRRLGAPTDDLRPRLVAVLWAATLRLAVAMWVEGRPGPLSEIFAELFAATEAGLAGAEPRPA